MKVSTIIWQIIVLVLGFSLLFITREFMQDKLRMDASIGYANCVIAEQKENLSLGSYCYNIKTFKIKGYNE